MVNKMAVFFKELLDVLGGVGNVALAYVAPRIPNELIDVLGCGCIFRCLVSGSAGVLAKKGN